MTESCVSAGDLGEVERGGVDDVLVKTDPS